MNGTHSNLRPVALLREGELGKKTHLGGCMNTGVNTDGQGLVILAKSCHRLSGSRQVGSQLELNLEFSIPKTENSRVAPSKNGS